MASCQQEREGEVKPKEVIVGDNLNIQQKLSDSDDNSSCEEKLAEAQNFSLGDEEMERCLGILHKAKGREIPFEELCQTSTKHWSRKPLTASAAYKIFKVKRWLLKNASLVFDPFDQDEANITVRQSTIMWPEAEGPQAMQTDHEFVTLKALSVDGLLAKAQAQDVAIENLKKLDEVLKDIDQDVPSISGNPQQLLQKFLEKGIRILPRAAQVPFKKFTYTLIDAMDICTKGGKTHEMYFQYMFQQLFQCVTGCINEDHRVDCAMSLDGSQLDKMELCIRMKNDNTKTLVVSSRPGLFMYERGADFRTKRIVAVVEAKGKLRDQVLHSDGEEEEKVSSLGVIDEESDEELSFLEKLKTKKNSNMKRLDRDSREYTRKFLPQLVGEMLCCSETKGLHDIMANELGSTLGIAVVGFDVYFVTLVTSQRRVQDMLTDPGSYTNVFITRPFNLCKRRDRQFVFKVLSAACYVKNPLEASVLDNNHIF